VRTGPARDGTPVSAYISKGMRITGNVKNDADFPGFGFDYARSLSPFGRFNAALCCMLEISMLFRSGWGVHLFDGYEYLLISG
jgi:hypothetical protein